MIALAPSFVFESTAIVVFERETWLKELLVKHMYPI